MEAKADKESKVKAKNKDGKKTNKAKTKKKSEAKTKADDDPKFDLYQPVLVQWDKGGEFFQADVYRVFKNGKYAVYFFSDGLTKRGVMAEDMRSPTSPVPNWAKVNRCDLINMTFEHDDASHLGTPKALGEYKVIKLGEKRHINKYLCVHVKTATECHVNIGYVKNKLLSMIFPNV
jgi:hypothetical protein